MDIRAEAKVLALWETAAQRSALTRAVILAAEGAVPADVAELGVGQCDTRLLALRRECFGPNLDCVVDCPECGAELELQLCIDDLTIPDTGRARGSVHVDGVDIEFRAVTSGDLIAVGGRPDAREALIERCVTGSRPRTDAALDAVSDGLAQLDPQAAVSIRIDCAVCGHRWDAPFDIAGYLWSELQACAVRTMRDVHELATAYGWSEADVLSVSPVRRHHYLELAAP